ncbi:hypothetical protein BDF20DRAFT_884991, partial [Mycotypha africana]|uniref:uncharacterized protein n=1 Tax=Mycotypha africana TaxID=64632 RepID=UPI002301B6FD
VIQVFIDTVKIRINAGTFSPTKYTDTRGHRFFSLAPLYSVKTKSIQMDAQAFWRLVKEANVDGYKTGKKT